ncbi:hypothetical protein [Streptomyces shenzhenensis]|uniref:hypothetical protein n=1 Tax=Streptomyces shenzhenensis TaxID=943815 RepID=UPI001C6940DB|nr:hypothetical protein [Streptomyces shenzhenensis]
MSENVIALRFARRAAAYQALSGLRYLNSANAEVRGAVLIERLEDGAVRVTEGLSGEAGWNPSAGRPTDSPTRFLARSAGWRTCVPSGMGHDDEQAAESGDPGSAFPPQAPSGGAVILAEVREAATETLDLLALWYGAALERRPADSVPGGLKAVEEARGESGWAGVRGWHGRGRGEAPAEPESGLATMRRRSAA